MNFLQTTIALLIPVSIIGCGALSKKLVRGGSFQYKDFYLGIPLALSSLTSAIVFIYELCKSLLATPNITRNMAYRPAISALFSLFCFFLLLVQLCIHQEWENKDQSPIRQRIWLGIVSNLLGVIMLGTFIIWVKGV